MSETNKIKGISFIRKTDDINNKPEHEVILHFKSKIPAIGYSPKKLRKLLKIYDKPFIYTKRDGLITSSKQEKDCKTCKHDSDKKGEACLDCDEDYSGYENISSTEIHLNNKYPSAEEYRKNGRKT